MKKDPLVAYIAKEVEKGFSESLVRAKLAQVGYTDDEIAHAFSSYHRDAHYHRVISDIVDKETEKRWIVITLGVVALALIAVLGLLLLQGVNWDMLGGEETVRIDPQEESDCSIFSHRDKERCLLRVAAYHDDTSFCTNLTSTVMTYQCKRSVWNANYCNFLILTNQSTTSC